MKEEKEVRPANKPALQHSFQEPQLTLEVNSAPERMGKKQDAFQTAGCAAGVEPGSPQAASLLWEA